MRRAAEEVFRNLTVEEDEMLMPNGFTTPSGAPVSSLAALFWAMEETEFGDPAQKKKWWGFRSRHRFPAGPEEFVVGAVMAIPTPGTSWVPIPIEDSKEEEELDTGAHVAAADLARDGEGEEKIEDLHPPSLSTLSLTLTAPSRPLSLCGGGVGVSPVGNRFWLLAGEDADKGTGTLSDSSGQSHGEDKPSCYLLK